MSFSFVNDLTYCGDEDSCSICLQDYEAGDILLRLACRHTFHRECLQMYGSRSVNPSCPRCRGGLRITAQFRHVSHSTDHLPADQIFQPVIRRLHDKGLSAAEIAEVTSLDVRTVVMVLTDGQTLRELEVAEAAAARANEVAEAAAARATELAELDAEASARAGEQRVLVLSELNFTLVWRAWEAVEGLQGHAEQLPTGQLMYIRPGADRFVAALLREPRCCLAFISCNSSRYSLPMAQGLLKRAAPGDWQIEEPERQPPSIVYKGSVGKPRQLRVYVFSQELMAEERRGAERTGTAGYVKNIYQAWDNLHMCGHSFNIDNTVILDNCRDSNVLPESVVELPRWKAFFEGAEWKLPVEAESDWEALREYFFEILANPPLSMPGHLESHPCQAFRS